MIMKVGRVCRLVRGKYAGEYCVIVERLDKNFVVVDGDKIKRKKVNILHLEPLPDVIKIKKTYSSEKIKNLFRKEFLENYGK
ncbi:MAG: 50S ribosomal protein L14e [Candidatus Altiarchaeales archaeon]|nr:MAG: 50S ribosomal protein L14e [Candidatus Altiarchaeales archaeon]HDO82125.1 50S ribosomal protein L14e [Candidatus Altiarchaeales archaeon]HEX54774.1 50S ribosomal protein L14e [Candidatus Altiarchaeales archaeon]